MATDFTQDSVLHFIQSRGGSVRNSDLLLHFRGFLRDHAEQVQNRELFKKFVNSVATVKQEHGASHVVLRKKFRTSAPGGGGTTTSGTVAGRTAEPSPEKAALNPARGRGRARQKEEPTPTVLSGEVGMKNVLPAAGIILNNNNNVQANLNLTPTAAETQTWAQSGPAPRHQYLHVGPQKVGFVSASVQHIKQTEPSLHQGPGLSEPRRARHRQSYKTAVSYDEDEDEGIQMKPGGHLGPISASTIDQHVATPSSPERSVPKIYIQNVEQGKGLPSHPGWSLESRKELRPPRQGLNLACLHEEVMPTRRSLPAECSLPEVEEEGLSSQPGGAPLDHRQGCSQRERAWMSTSHNSIFSPSSHAGLSCGDWSLSGPGGAGWNCSTEKLQVTTGDLVGAIESGEVLQRAHETTELGSAAHHADTKVKTSWHRSTGDLYDDHESSDGSASSPAPHQRPTLARRVSRRLRGRMCRSVGADLDQLLHEEAAPGRAGGNEAARLNRLHRISSSLSLRYNLSSSSLSSCSTPSRCNSLADLAEGAEAKGNSPPTTGSTHHESPSRQSLVPLEPREHAWLVKGAAGAWPDIYSLFREDPTLLNRRDFISGFTVLHWIAKHGDHRVLNTLWYGVQKAGSTFDINARSSCGQTPLHIAAMHSNKNMIRLLVNKFHADVKLRDTAGKKPWQYLSQSAPVDVAHMLGAPVRSARRGEGGATGADHSSEQKPHHHRRHRRHHLSSASSGERPRTVSGAKVKRSSSIAAFLKHKSLSRFHGYKSDG
ncbi:ankyrin repeat domain-containing protein SOWAHB-like [Dunckerocampus dactyliophorus]|uniref:ankyrin repeat domain-containing protein SOWAHB-like n=1 Tax=Dunckerocampus dactyliophorus TaxID=161453 RepID=UPI0024067B10|nr:ankyrin repeat domain-containing protein SOWAHB-like [Dunckerocampus dactyliophorus]